MSEALTEAIRVLIVDPDVRFGLLLKGFLESRGWQTEWVSDGRKALARWDEVRPRLLVCELQGDEYDGFELIDAAARTAEQPAVVVCTRLGGASAWGEQPLAELGVKAVLVRPIRLDDLALALESALFS